MYARSGKKKNIEKTVAVVSLLLLSFFVTHAQRDAPPQPAACLAGNGDGYQTTITTRAPSALQCSDPSSPEVDGLVFLEKGGRNFTNVKAYYSIDNSFSLAAPNVPAVDAVDGGTRWNMQKKIAPVHHWVLTVAEEGGVKYKRCNYMEVISRVAPTANVNLCDPTTAKVEIIDSPDNRFDRFEINFGSGTPVTYDMNTTSLPINVSRPNTGRPVTVRGIYIRNGNEVCSLPGITIDKNNPNLPVITKLEMSEKGATATLDFIKFLPSVEYDLQIAEENGSGNYSWQSSGKVKDGKAVLTGLNPSKKYCFKLVYTDVCGDQHSSRMICSSNLVVNGLTSESAELNWNKPTEPAGIPRRLRVWRIVQNCTGSTCLNLVAGLSVLDTKAIVDNLPCTDKYTFKVEYVYRDSDNNDITIISEEEVFDPVAGLSNVIPSNLVQVSYDAVDEQLLQFFVIPEGNIGITSMDIFRSSVSSSGFEFITKVNSNKYDDIAVNPSTGAYCYKFEMTDACNVKSALSPEYCSIYLSLEGKNRLKWSPYLIPTETSNNIDEVSYVVERFDPIVNSYAIIGTTYDTSYSLQDLIKNARDPEVRLRVQGKMNVLRANSANQFIFSYSNTVIVKIPPTVISPNAFSPNNDGSNDLFEFKTLKFLSKATFVVYNRWGNIVYESNDLSKPWDGNGIPDGSYSYKIQGTSDGGEPFMQMGTVTIVR